MTSKKIFNSVTAVTSHISFLVRWRSLVTARNGNGLGKMTEVIEAQ